MSGQLIDSALVHSVLAQWDLADARAERMEGGEVKDLWLIDARNRPDRLVLRVYPSCVTEQQVQQELAWTTALAARVPEIPTGIPSTTGALIIDVGERVAVLSPFVSGARPRRESAAHRASAASLLGRIHAATRELELSGCGFFPPLANFDWSANEWWIRADVERQFRHHPLLNAATDRLNRVPEILSALTSLPKSLVHNDFHGGNMIADETAIVAVVDWDWACIDWPLLDVVAGLRSFIDYGPVAIDHALDFVLTYRESAHISERELMLLPSVMLLRSWWSTWYDLGRAARGRISGEELAFRASDLPRFEAFAGDFAAALRAAY